MISRNDTQQDRTNSRAADCRRALFFLHPRY